AEAFGEGRERPRRMRAAPGIDSYPGAESLRAGPDGLARRAGRQIRDLRSHQCRYRRHCRLRHFRWFCDGLDETTAAASARPIAGGGVQPTSSITSFFWAGVNSGPKPALRLSLWRSGLPVAGITAVTASWLRQNFRNICAHEVMPTSAAQSGSALPLTWLNSLPSLNLRLASTA